MEIWANTIINNEENFIWFSIMSVVDYVDKLLIYDTGSTDKSFQIVEGLKKQYPGKIICRKKNKVDEFELTKLRQEMLEESKCDWILILDGDEVWWKSSICKAIEKIKKMDGKIDGIVVPVVVCIGDIYHYQEEKAGKYNLLGRQGHFNLRFINRKIPGLYVDKEYPLEGFFDHQNNLIQDKKTTIFLDAPYLHLSHLKRSSKKKDFNKQKSEIGFPFPNSFKYPESLSLTYPDIVPNPWVKLVGLPLLKAKILTPLRRIKRRII